MKRQAIHTDEAPRALGPYSQAIVTGKWVFTAGQIGLDPETGDLRGGIEAQAVQVLRNLRHVLAEAGCDWSDVLKTTVYLQDMADFTAFNAIYAEYVSEPFPARSTVQASGLPKDALIEIDCVARRA